MTIPTSFKLINRQWTVEYMTQETHEAASADGVCLSSEASIRLYPPASTAEHLVHTFYHELIHAMFDTAGRNDLSSDEALVDIMGALLHQYFLTKKGRLE